MDRKALDGRALTGRALDTRASVEGLLGGRVKIRMDGRIDQSP